MVLFDSWMFVWGTLGALIGYAASQKRGYSPVAGVLGGLFLGPVFGLLLFMASGVSRSDDNVKCPQCAEWIKRDARICKHCGNFLPTGLAVALSPFEQQQQAVPPVLAKTKRPLAHRIGIGIGLFFTALIGVPLLLMILVHPESLGSPSRPPLPYVETLSGSGLTYANYQRLQDGMTYAEVIAILGSRGTEISRSDLAGYTTVMYNWETGLLGANMNAMFQNDKLMSKAQFGLR